MPSKQTSTQNFHPTGIGDRFWHHAVLPVLRLFANDGIEFFGRLRFAVNTVVVMAIGILIASPFTSTSRMVETSGLMFDIAGALRLFLLDQITAAVKPFADETKYPYGPPSYAMREFVMPESGPYTMDSPYMYDFYYRNRGIIFLVIGFSLQATATWLPL